MLQGQQHFDQTGHPGGGFEVTDIRFDGADEQWFGGIAAVSQCCGGGLHLNGVTQLSPGAVCLQIGHVAGIDSGSAEGLTNHFFLCPWIWCRQSTAEAIMPDRGSLNDAQNRVAVTFCVGQAAEADDPAPFASQVTICGCIEGPGMTTGRQRLQLACQDIRSWRTDCIHAAHQGEITFPLLQTLASEMQRHQRRRTSRINGHTGPLQTQVISQSTTQKTAGGPRRDVRIQIQK
jgi:hypothetical protein